MGPATEDSTFCFSVWWDVKKLLQINWGSMYVCCAILTSCTEP